MLFLNLRLYAIQIFLLFWNMTNSVLFRLEEFPTRYRHYDHLMSEASAKLPSFPVLKIIHYKHYIKQKSVLVLFPGGFANEVFLEQISNRIFSSNAENLSQMMQNVSSRSKGLWLKFFPSLELMTKSFTKKPLGHSRLISTHLTKLKRKKHNKILNHISEINYLLLWDDSQSKMSFLNLLIILMKLGVSALCEVLDNFNFFVHFVSIKW